MIRINLVPAEILLQEQQRRRVLQAAAVGVLILLLFAGVSFVHWNTGRMLEAKLQRNQAELAKLKVIVDQVKQLEATAQAVKHRLDVIQSLLSGRFLYTVFLEDWLRAMPSGVWLTNLTTTYTGKGMTIQSAANARTQEDIAEWMRTLENDQDKYTNIELGPVTLSGGGGAESFFTFSLKGVYNFTPPKEVVPH